MAMTVKVEANEVGRALCQQLALMFPGDGYKEFPMLEKDFNNKHSELYWFCVSLVRSPLNPRGGEDSFCRLIEAARSFEDMANGDGITEETNPEFLPPYEDYPFLCASAIHEAIGQIVLAGIGHEHTRATLAHLLGSFLDVEELVFDTVAPGAKELIAEMIAETPCN